MEKPCVRVRSRAGKHRRRTDKSDESNLPAVFGAKKLVEIDKEKPYVSDGRRVVAERLSASTEMNDGWEGRSVYFWNHGNAMSRALLSSVFGVGTYRARLFVRK